MNRTTNSLYRLLSTLGLAAIAACVLAVSAPTAMAGPWSRATGEAVELQRTTKDLRNRMSRLYGYIPATQNAIVLDELATHLISATKSNIALPDMQAQLDQFDAVYQDVRLANATEGALAGDRNVARYTTEIDRRFDRLVKDLGRAKVPVYLGSVMPRIISEPILGTGPIISSSPVISSAPAISSSPLVGSPTSPRGEAVVRYRIPRLLDRVLGQPTVVEQAPQPIATPAPLPRVSL
jgi:hypothetical protein